VKWDWEKSLKAAIRVGVSIKGYDDMTPYQLSLIIDNYNELKKMESEDKLVLTYLGAYWQRVKKMPSIKEILKQPKKKMTAEEILAEVKKINTSMGGTTY
jgi:sulfur relay (sulfurtransferase) DsrC/TusE family protein